MFVVRKSKPRDAVLAPILHLAGKTRMRLGDALRIGVICH